MSVPQKMTVAQVLEQGPARFVLAEQKTPTPGPGQVLIRVEACGVNFADVKRRRGDAYPFPTRFPFVPGSEVAGLVVAHGAGVDGPPIGASVFALAGHDGSGGYAQFAVADARSTIPIPAGLSTDVASVLLVAGSTAQLLLQHAAQLKPGERVLIPAATGGVGSFAVQLARRAGAGHIVAVVGAKEKVAAATALGAHSVVVATDDAWPEQVLAQTGGHGVDVALEASGGDALEQTLRCLAPFGRAVVYGAASGRAATLSTSALNHFLYAPAPNQSLTAFNVGGWFQGRPGDAQAALGAVIGGLLSGQLQAPAITTLRLAEAGAAHERLERRAVTGKLVITPWA